MSLSQLEWTRAASSHTVHGFDWRLWYVESMDAMTSLCKDHETSIIVQYPSLLATSAWAPLKFQAFLFLQNVIEVAFSAGVEPALNSMIADRSRGNEDIRGDGFAALGVIMHLSDTLQRTDGRCEERVYFATSAFLLP